ncbi:NAD(P)-dependent oxidoreductase [Lentilactobacillus hilgardii]|uniref:Phosphogluconate dehydrogenase (Decarboxylating), NAD binding domain protein n=1 Tax=Lentilactobacillus hilgardii (strain ATCC 8290 / DSM 20176 / CCUG 30140 / JCM 1155 / KCTC 3500 / NBRC 15886 / NCIMB 8040 / NRRL B-1843 / 9) TaxID=1423757 RepID=C0XNH0_LENH9|nr:NAD(P)-dependent oxidoreductase [Lentilactobacillus hilgardii]EEI23096.1 phosphogluconate dehydrogenase (decarboxylating), NAD binding domain protein [Lentilactobacillus hilgardii DSM 20176 = ATCC 8290]KRK54013.1 2-hydroxy-3-oxopropionate reductase [Lentilactobacillus hilgardii DSM 20176 = ATCC 8290]QEU38183.1 NAD(P)-dependent oxidoreductase [Lentilactobacillus hilgardii]
MKIGFIGTGVMGTGMINNLLKANFEVTVYNRTKAHAQEVLNHGASWQQTPADVAKVSDVVITIVGFPKDVEEVYFGHNGIFETARPGETLIDMTTSSPVLAKKIFSAGQDRQIDVLDAPVSGGDVGARNGSLTIMVGGQQAAYEHVLPVFNAMGTSVTRFGGAGQGQNAKMANQIMIAGTMTGLTEALIFAKAAGLDQAQMIKTIQGGGAANWSMGTYGPRILKDDLKPGFYAKHFLKDLRIALDAADEMEIQLPATQKAKDLYEAMVDQFDLGNLGTQGLIKIYDK